MLRSGPGGSDLVVDPRWPVSQGIRTSDIVKSVIGLLSMGRSDFDAIKAFRKDPFFQQPFQQSLGLNKVPSRAWLLQRLDAVAGDLRERVAEMTQRLLERTEAPVTGHQGFVCVDVDTLPWTTPAPAKSMWGAPARGFHGYTPVAAYMGNEGWCVGLEWVQNAQAARAFKTEREGKRVAHLTLPVVRTWGQTQRSLRLMVQVTERSVTKPGQMLLVPEIELQGWWTTLDKSVEEVMALYRHHGTHEQFHSEIKSDLDLERLPSGKFDTNDAILHLASFTYNCLRLLGQLGLTGTIAPVRHPAKRRRLKTVQQEIMYRAAKVVAHARQWVLDFGRGVAAHAQVFVLLQQRLAAASP
jgi:hypothetical protein